MQETDGVSHGNTKKKKICTSTSSTTDKARGRRKTTGNVDAAGYTDKHPAPLGSTQNHDSHGTAITSTAGLGPNSASSSRHVSSVKVSDPVRVSFLR